MGTCHEHGERAEHAGDAERQRERRRGRTLETGGEELSSRQRRGRHRVALRIVAATFHELAHARFGQPAGGGRGVDPVQQRGMRGEQARELSPLQRQTVYTLDAREGRHLGLGIPGQLDRAGVGVHLEAPRQVEAPTHARQRDRRGREPRAPGGDGHAEDGAQADRGDHAPPQVVRPQVRHFVRQHHVQLAAAQLLEQAIRHHHFPARRQRVGVGQPHAAGADDVHLPQGHARPPRQIEGAIA